MSNDGYGNDFARSQAAFRMGLAEECRCGGGGWVLSNLDVWESCPFHPGERHPEDEDDDAYTRHFECAHCGADFRLNFDACGDACPVCDEGSLIE